MRFYEVAPDLAMTQHAITIRPLCFSGKTLAKLPNDLQAAIRRAGKEASAYHRQAESGADEPDRSRRWRRPASCAASSSPSAPR